MSSSSSPIFHVLEKLKNFAQSDTNRNKCTPKYTLKLICDQLKYGQPVYQLKHSSQQFDSNKMEIFYFEVYFDSRSSENLKGQTLIFNLLTVYRIKFICLKILGENLPYGKYKTAQHLAALNLLKKIFDSSNEKKIGNDIM